jgi:hypothetical protein
MENSIVKIENSEIIEKAKNYTTNRVKKEYLLLEGKAPKEVNKANPFNPHAYIISEAIKSLIKEGIEKTTKDNIMERAVDLGLYSAKPSKSSPSYIFSWWFSSLKNYGFIS